MFFKDYAPLTAEAVEQAVKAAHGPADGNEDLTGLRFSARLEGEFAPAQLDYEVLDAGVLRCTENGRRFEAPYGAACLGSVLLLSHGVPGTDRAWHLVIDRRGGAMTAFETWFGVEVAEGVDHMGALPPLGSSVIPREVQRQFSFGWADFGSGAQRPEKLHGTTNRLEGRGLHWRYSDGYEILTFFPSVTSFNEVFFANAPDPMVFT